MFIASVMPPSHLIPWCPLLLLPSIFSSIRDSSNELSVCIRWPKYWDFSFRVSPSSEYSGLISLKIDWFDLLYAQRIFRSLLKKNCTWSQKDKYGKDIWWLSISFTICLIIAQEEEWKANEIDAKFRDVLFKNFTEVMKYTIHRFKMPVNPQQNK